MWCAEVRDDHPAEVKTPAPGRQRPQRAVTVDRRADGRAGRLGRTAGYRHVCMRPLASDGGPYARFFGVGFDRWVTGSVRPAGLGG